MPKEKIILFFKENLFDSSILQDDLEKWYFWDKYFSFSLKDLRKAKAERKELKKLNKQEFKRRQNLEEINGIYIPKDIYDCFLQLDKLLSEVEKKLWSCFCGGYGRVSL